MHASIDPAYSVSYYRRRPLAEPPMTLDQELTRIFTPVHPRFVLMFGSLARGAADAHGDIDLIIVYDTDKRFMERLDELYSLWDLPVAVDMLAYTPEEFERMKRESYFVADAVEHGRIVYQAA